MHEKKRGADMTGSPLPLFDLTGKVVAVSGASRGIGLGIARAFLRQGASVAVGGLHQEETAAAAEQLRSEFASGPGRVSAVWGDASNEAVARSFVEDTLDFHGRLDTLIANAGIDIIQPALACTPSQWDAIMAVNVRAGFQLAQAAARIWTENPGPGRSVIFTSSIAGSVGIPTLAPYAASKGAINQLVKTLAIEWAEFDIRVNAIAPGYVESIMDGVTAHDDPASDQRIARFTPLGRRARIEEIAAPFVFLASAEASYITGAVLAVDGGYTAN
ncbi:SDR family NAD(P)-dependent oxidoreductase [Arthrobacter sp. Leaf337]|uniref:SDR family NAD(P)-dependent oxidoreductase n=1 Tax=Arthrobacter sp. Leaf337 TaxID=1736342 RepID=UPI00138F754D|nr:SDR family oxidoreductase [Arthrobacter sp. Leaf337]